MTAAVSLRQPQARDVWLPTPSRADRDVPRASKGHCIVHAVFGDGEGVRVQAESLLEHKWQLIVSARPETLELREQVLFRWGDRPTDKHVFDMVVKERSGRRIAYTVKPEIRLRSGRFLAEIQEIAYWVKFKQFADDVRLLTDTDLDPVELYNARVTAAVAKPDAEADSRAVALAATLTGARSIRDLTQALGMGERSYRAVLRLLRNHRLCTARTDRITPETLVRRPEETRA
ncbi:hypothetical protein [Cereibacter johrii]|uniref:hypothetical protein n=1 Tax=Cereibacter johrii TaxID=445629 RepID=UPI000DCE8230|nr:hypothetical protein [Cereibacter johrii]RAZ81737.1 hypothetical protein DDV93_22350 [Cereibacter johrii]